MPSHVPPSLPPKGSRSRPAEQKSASRTTRKKVAPTRSARRVNNGTVSKGKDVTHEVRVTVLGLAGITVDRSMCRSSSESNVRLPAPPSKMRAVVAFSRNSAICGTTTLSKELTRSPSNHVVVEASESEEEILSAVRSGGDTVTDATKSSGGSRTRRHLALWASDDNTNFGSSVIFEANLHRSDAGGAKGTGASSAFAPKSFELTIALTDSDNSGQAVVALPLGVASLAISGNESSKGKNITLDLPVLSLSQARPMGASDRMGGYPMISLAPRQKAAEAAETISGARAIKKKRSGLKKFFSKKDKSYAIATSIPSAAERKAFAAAYSMDSGGDAILRVTLEVYEKEAKESGILSHATAKKLKKPSKSKEAESSGDVSNRLETLVARREEETSVDQESGDEDSYNSDDGTEYTNETEYSDNDSDFSGSIRTGDDETITLDDTMVTTEDNRIAFFSWVNGPTRNKDRGRKGGREEGRKGQPFPFFLLEDEEGMVSVSVLGRQIRLPACGSLSVNDGDGHSRNGNSTVGDNLTHITADCMGKSYHIPACPDDSDSTTTYTERNSVAASRIAKVLNGAWCQSRGMESKDIDISGTFSTLSEEAEKIVVSNNEKSDAKDEILATNEAKVPEPDERSEADEIIGIVRSKQPSRSPKDSTARRDVEIFVARTEVSPKGVAEYAPAEAEAPTTPTAKIVKNISELFHCQSAQKIGPRYEPFQPHIPQEIIRSDHDLVSVGELTATTHEQNIAAEARLLEKARQIFSEKAANTNKRESRGRGVVCVGGGFCSPLIKRNTTSSPIRVTSEDSSSILEGHRSHHSQNNFIDCDENTTFSPVEVEKVESKEKGTSFSRVRDPSSDKPKPGSALNTPARSLYSNSLPVFASIGGDGSESIIGAFTNSNNGVEVDQAIL